MADEDYRRLAAACGCGAVLPPYGGRGARQRYCSPACRPSFSRLYYEPRPRDVRAVSCLRCGVDVQTKGSRALCISCRQAGRYVPAPEPVKRCCTRCGASFKPLINSGRFCSSRCRVDDGNERQALRKAASKAALPERACKWCAAAFKPEYGDFRQLYCSRACEESRRRKERSGTSHRRRAKRYGVPFQHVNRLKVFERDRWRCQLCSRKVGLAEAELDHIVPLSKGGPHSYENTQCSCKACNSAKRDRPLGQQRLFG